MLWALANMKAQQRMFSLADANAAFSGADLTLEQLKAIPLIKYLGRDATTGEEMFQPELPVEAIVCHQ